LEGSGSGLIKVLSWHFPGEIEENNKKSSVRITSDPDEIQTKHHLNATQEHYHCINLFSQRLYI
jgi:hypothetical protein